MLCFIICFWTIRKELEEEGRFRGADRLALETEPGKPG